MSADRQSRSALSDADVELLRALWDSEEAIRAQEDAGLIPRPAPGRKTQRFWTFTQLAEKFEISRRQVANIVGYHQRVARRD